VIGGQAAILNQAHRGAHPAQVAEFIVAVEFRQVLCEHATRG